MKEHDFNSEVIYKNHIKRYYKRALMPCDLNILDHLSMSKSLELRVPFVDINLYENVMKYSYENHFQFGYSKYMLRQVSESTPNIIRWNKTKSRRPNVNKEIIYDILSEDLIAMFSEEIPLINTQIALKRFIQDRKKRNSYSAHFWFRLYTYIRFWEINFRSQ